jgi:adenylylsulfate kinase-like enzyme
MAPRSRVAPAELTATQTKDVLEKFHATLRLNNNSNGGGSVVASELDAPMFAELVMEMLLDGGTVGDDG